MPKAGLQRAGVVSAISEAITAGVPKHVLGCAQTDDSSGLAAFEISAILTAIGNCSAKALATSVAIMNRTGTDLGRNSGTEIVTRNTTLPSSAWAETVSAIPK